MTTEQQPRCENCRHSLDEGFISVLECRRHAPVVANYPHLAVQRRFPKVAREDWCGEFEKKPE